MRWLLRLRARRGRAPRARRSFSARFFLKKKRGANAMAAAVARGARGRALGAARPEAAPRGRAARRALRSARPRPKGAPLVFRSFF